MGVTLPWRVIAQVLVMVVLSASVAVASSQGGTIPIRWARELGLASLSELGAEMARPLDGEVEVIDRADRRAVARDCDSLLDVLARGYGARRDVEERVLRYQSVRCLALRALSTALPARRSALRGLRWSEAIMSVLPPTLDVAVSAEAEQRARRAESQGKTWRRTAPRARVTLEPPSADRLDPSLVVEHEGSRVRVTEYARADFDGDGHEDVMVRVDAERMPGTYRSHRLFLLRWDAGRRALRTLREVVP